MDLKNYSVEDLVLDLPREALTPVYFVLSAVRNVVAQLGGGSF